MKHNEKVAEIEALSGAMRELNQCDKVIFSADEYNESVRKAQIAIANQLTKLIKGE